MKKLMVVFAVVVLLSSIASASTIVCTNTIAAAGACSTSGFTFSNWLLSSPNGSPLPGSDKENVSVILNDDGSVSVKVTPVTASDWQLNGQNMQFSFALTYKVTTNNLPNVFLQAQVADVSPTGNGSVSLTKGVFASCDGAACTGQFGGNLGASDPGTKLGPYVNITGAGNPFWINDNFQANTGSNGSVNATAFFNNFQTPEPATLGLLGLGLLGIGYLARRKRA